MAGMDIVLNGEAYELVIENVGVVGLVADEAAVMTLAQSMAAGLNEVVANSEFIFEAGQMTQDGVVALFDGVAELTLQGELIFDATAVGAASLLEALTAVGEALLAAL